jgi:hypothetical protein
MPQAVEEGHRIRILWSILVTADTNFKRTSHCIDVLDRVLCFGTFVSLLLPAVASNCTDPANWTLQLFNCPAAGTVGAAGGTGAAATATRKRKRSVVADEEEEGTGIRGDDAFFEAPGGAAVSMEPYSSTRLVGRMG